MVVKVDVAGLRRAPRRTEGGGFFVAFVPSRANTADPSAVAQAVESGNALFEPGEDQVLVAAPAQMPAGLVAFVSEVDSPTVWDAWLQEVAARLESAGWDGRVREVKNDHTPYDAPGNEVDATGAGIVLPVDSDRFAAEAAAARAGRGRRSRWLVPTEVTEFACAAALDYILDGPGELYLSQAEVQFKIDAASIADAFRRLLVEQAQIPIAMTRISANGDLARVYVDRHGHIHYEARDTTSGWEGEVAQLLPIIGAHAELAEYGLIRRIYSPAIAWRGIIRRRTPLPPIEDRAFWLIPRELENSWVPDAYPVQLLTNQHLEKANDLTGWRTERLSDRLHLVSHPDPAAWLGVDEPDADLVGRARADFGDMIARRKHW